jgi:hypothetical protein
MGPYFGEQWAEQEPGEALISRVRIRFAYVCAVPWSTNGW